MDEYRLGILGGMGPQATNTFYQYIIDRTDAKRDQEHVNTLIFSDSGIPDRTAAILSGNTKPAFERLLMGAKLLEDAGCTVLTIPCNTAHYFVDDLQKELKIPIIHMLRETAKLLASQGKTRPGILATDGTIQTGLYQREFAKLGVEVVSPSPAAQKAVMSLIYDDIKAGKAGDPDKFAAVDADLRKQGCDCGVLACTELSVYATQQRLPEFYVDAMAVLAQRAVEACHKPLKTL